MTVRELIEAINFLPDDCEVRFEYDGPDATTEIKVDGFIISDDYTSILLVKGEN